MAHENRFITSAGTNIWFAAAQAKEWNGSSPTTPWTSQADTPFEIAMNDTTGERWTSQEAAPIDVYAGGTPLPRTPQSYPRVTEVLPIQIRGTTQNAMIAALRLLKQELRSLSLNAPALFVFKPDGATNAGYTEVYSANVATHPFFINDENGRSILRATLTIERAPFFTNLAAGISALSSGTHTNQAGSNTRNLPTTLNGDLSNEGLPLNIHIVGAGALKYIGSLFLASVAASASSTSGAGSLSGASTTTAKATVGFTSASHAALFTAIANNERTRLRILQRFSSVTNNTVVQLQVPGVGWSPRIKLASGDRVVDFGDFLPEPQRYRSSELGIRLYLISGGPITLVNTEALAYYDFAHISRLIDLESYSGDYVDVTSFRAASNRATLPLAAPIVTYYSHTADVDYSPQPYYGSLPRAYPGAKLWLAWTAFDQATSNPDTAFTEQLSTTATYTPLFLSFRGSQ